MINIKKEGIFFDDKYINIAITAKGTKVEFKR